MSTEVIAAPSAASKSIGAEQVTSRQMAEVQAAMAIAKRFPRDENLAIAKIDTACSRAGLAAESQYEYSKGGGRIKGPSIRLAEVLAQCWGNLDFGWIELDRHINQDGIGVSVIQAYAWDLESNTRRTLVFDNLHWRDTQGGGKKVESERDIYELNANMAARRMRTCILNIIPGDICDLAIEKCDKTLAGQTKEPIQDAVRKMVIAFKEYGVTVEMLSRKVQCSLEAVSHTQLHTLRKAYQSLKDGVASRDDLFDVGDDPESGEATGSKADEAAKKIADKKAKAAKAKASEEPKQETREETRQQETKEESQQQDDSEGDAEVEQFDDDGEEDKSPSWKQFYDMYQKCKKKSDYAKFKAHVTSDKNPCKLNESQMKRATRMCDQGIENAE